MEKEPLRVNQKSPTSRCSMAFKRKIVKEYEGGFLNKDQLAAKYGIKGKSTVLDWCRQYGKLAYPTTHLRALGRPMKDPQKQRIKELEQALSDALAQLKAYHTLIQIAEKEEGIVILKKDGTRPSSP